MLLNSKDLNSFFRNPHLVFIESSCPAFLSKYSDGYLFFYTREASVYSQDKQRVLIVPSYLMRYLKIFFTLFRFPCTLQSCFGIAYRLSKSKSLISDGILTELLYSRGYIKPKKLISITDIVPSLMVKENMQLILGNNWYEFGILSLQRYEKYLQILNKSFPDAYYYPHPKEGRDLLRRIFGFKLIEATENIEAYCSKNSIPGNIIGFLGSTAMATLGKLAESNIKIHAIKFDAQDCDGPLGDVTDPFLLKKLNIKITLGALEDTVESILRSVRTVSIKEIKISFQ